MPLSWNEIKDRALRFSRDWAQESSEDAEAKSFWDGFFHIFGISRRRVATFERKVKKLDGRDGFIDLLWRGVLLIEHKSRGKDLDRAHSQARDYFAGLTEAELPRWLLVSDFARFRLYDLESAEPPVEFAIGELHKHVRRFGFIAGYQARSYQEEDPVNVQAAERMGRLHDALKASGYEGHALEVLLVRLLFCLFADDTGIFERNAFTELLNQRTGEDGADLGQWLTQLFQVLNTPRERRQRNLDEQLAEFPYVNGRLFEEFLPIPAFDARMRATLLEATTLDWSRISPAIFGSMFQSVMDAKARRNLGAHYTSEKNILKLIGPLFLDELRAELEKIGGNTARLKSFHIKLANLRFLDPACGCGNFLVIAYRELRLLELEVLKRLYAVQDSLLTRVSEHVAVDVDQFYGIEIEEFPAQIAQVALWLMDHQMNTRVGEQFGEYFARLPLVKSATIVHGNALRIDWNDVVPKERLSYILGNPPFVGKKEQSKEQKQDLAIVFSGIRGSGVLDLVCAWYVLSARYAAGSHVRIAFVSTNSIAQGEQVGVLWSEMYRLGMHIQFAHRTFRWSNEARGNAAVHCVIVGFGSDDAGKKRLFEYAHGSDEPQEILADRVNPYLVDAPEVLLDRRSAPLCDAPQMVFGSKAVDFGFFMLDEQERGSLIASEPAAQRWIKPCLGGEDFLNGGTSWCLWLKGIQPQDLRAMPLVAARVEAVRSARKASKKAPTRQLADFPTVFGEDRQPSQVYLVVPKVSSERRTYVPLGFLGPEYITTPTVLVIPGATIPQFGVVQSLMHMAWMRYTCGRMKSDYQYSNTIVYNNFPWPEPLDDKARSAIEAAAQAVLDARAAFPDSTLADLYDPLSMPPALVKAHQQLDRAVDAAYTAVEKAAGRKAPKLGTDAERVAFLFERYQALTSLLPAEKPKRGRAKARAAQADGAA